MPLHRWTHYTRRFSMVGLQVMWSINSNFALDWVMKSRIDRFPRGGRLREGSHRGWGKYRSVSHKAKLLFDIFVTRDTRDSVLDWDPGRMRGILFRSFFAKETGWQTWGKVLWRAFGAEVRSLSLHYVFSYFWRKLNNKIYMVRWMSSRTTR